jgi:hypothetical protein
MNECVVAETTVALETRAAGSEVGERLVEQRRSCGRRIVPQSTLNDRR